MTPVDLAAAATELESRYPAERNRSTLIPLLHLVQERDGAITSSNVAEIASRLGLSPAEVRGVATFYHMFHQGSKGRHVLSVCHTLACDLAGAEQVISSLEDHFGVACRETTPDGEFTLERVECLAACDLAPVIQVDYDRIEAKQTPQSAVTLASAMANGQYESEGVKAPSLGLPKSVWDTKPLGDYQEPEIEPPLLIDTVEMTGAERDLLSQALRKPNADGESTNR